MSKLYLGIDIGGTAVKLGLVDETGAVLDRAERSVSFDNYRTPILDTVRAAAADFTAGRQDTLSGIGVSATGQIDSRQGIVAGTCGSLPGWVGAPIKARLEEDFRPARHGGQRRQLHVSGRSLGWVRPRAAPMSSASPSAPASAGASSPAGGCWRAPGALGGEMGHYRTHAIDGVDCTCGAKGCWERYASTTALVRAAKAMDPALTDGRAIFGAAREGRADVLALLDRWIDEIAQGLAGMVHIFNPQRILVGGRRQRPAGTADPAAGAQGEGRRHACLCRGAHRHRRGAAE